MMKRYFKFSLLNFLIVCSVLSVAIGSFLHVPRAALSMRVVGNHHRGNHTKPQIQITRPSSHFHVVITNQSNRNVRLWEAWNSWGHASLTFDVLDKTGKSLGMIEKIPFSQAVDIPTYLELSPKQHHVIDVYLNPTKWEIPVDPVVLRKQQGNQIVARYVSNNSAESKQYDVWTGFIEARPSDITLDYWPKD